MVISIPSPTFESDVCLYPVRNNQLIVVFNIFKLNLPRGIRLRSPLPVPLLATVAIPQVLQILIGQHCPL